MTYFRTVTYPPTQFRIPMKSGHEVWVSEEELNILKGGYYATSNSPHNRRKLYDVLKRIYAGYGFNAYEMCDDLLDAFPNCKEYERRQMYKWFPSFRDLNKKERRAYESMDRVFKEEFHGDLEALQKYVRKKVAPEPKETLGDTEPNERFKSMRHDKRRKT